jgi:hypothetical protein
MLRCWLLLTLGCVPPAAAQTYAIESDLLFYADNTEFTNPFRAGDSTLGVSGRILLDVTISDRVKVRGGLFGLGRFGSHQFLEHAEPAIALEISKGPSSFIFGSLATTAWRHDIAGPDLETPHRLLPPIQQETLTFTRGQEMGLQWLVESPRFEQDAWINWQRLNTAEQRERFDAGYRATLGLAGSLRLHGQWHVVHEGGQQFSNGSVKDSQAAALGLQWSIPAPAPTSASGIRLSLDAYAVLTEHIPNRSLPELTEVGVGAFSRAAVERGGWRAHLIVWRSRDTLKEEGDANYLAQRVDGTMFHKVRDYAEFGLTREFRPAVGVHLFAAYRLHRIESHYEYSYRVVSRVHLRRPL